MAENIQKLKENVVITNTVKIERLDDGIMKIDFLKGVVLTMDEHLKNMEIIKKIQNYKKAPWLVDLTLLKSAPKEVRDYGMKKETIDYVQCLAMVADSAPSKVIASFYLGLNKPSYPVKVFTSEKKAIDWLKIFISDSK